jgi:hypothetical protein
MLFTGVFLIRKSEKKLSALIWIAVSIMTSFAVQAAEAGVYYLTGISVGILSIGIFNIIISMILWIIIFRNGSQKYYIDKTDILAFLVIFLTAGLIYSKRFALGVDISFASVDSATAYDLAQIIVRTHKIPTNMFFAAVTSALPMEAALPITGVFNMYKTFTLWETGYFYMSGVFFYILVRRFLSTRGLKVVGIAASIIYFLGYPLYTLVFGFSYFGLSISVIAYILFAASLYIDGEVRKRNAVIMLNLGLLGLFLCYMMFVPAVFVGVLIALGIYLLRDGKLFSLTTIKTGFIVFLIPSVIGLLITASNLIFISRDTVVTGDSTGSRGIAMDGGCYNDMYSNFIILLPLIITGMVVVFKKLFNKDKRKDVSGIEITIASVFIVTLIFAAVLFINAMKGYVSIYYYAKINNVFALLSWGLIIIAAADMWSKTKEAVISYFAFIGILLIIIISGADTKIYDRNNRFIRVSAVNFLDIYNFNKEFVKYSGDLNIDDIRIIEYADNNLVIDNDSETPEVLVVGGAVYTAWYAKLTYNNNIIRINESSQLQSVNLLDYRYICVQNTAVYDENKELFDNLGNVLYSNTRGKIIEIK